MKIYLAGPIFTYGDLLRNTEWAQKIREALPGVDLYSPVENTDINGTEGKKKFAGSREIAKADNLRLNVTDVLVACIDGDVLPSGTCAEIGKFHEKIARGDHKHIIGICTDNRQCHLTSSPAKDAGGASELGEQQYSYQNLYVTGLIKQYGDLVYTIDEVIMLLKKYAREYGQKVAGKRKTDKELIEEFENDMTRCHFERFVGNYYTYYDELNDDISLISVTPSGTVQHLFREVNLEENE